jgi:hypothetical protein
MKEGNWKGSMSELEGVGAEDKKIGAESGDPNRRSQPRLPGSVVGEPSMRSIRSPYKITEVNVPK